MNIKNKTPGWRKPIAEQVKTLENTRKEIWKAATDGVCLGSKSGPPVMLNLTSSNSRAVREHDNSTATR